MNIYILVSNFCDWIIFWSLDFLNFFTFDSNSSWRWSFSRAPLSLLHHVNAWNLNIYRAILSSWTYFRFSYLATKRKRPRSLVLVRDGLLSFILNPLRIQISAIIIVNRFVKYRQLSPKRSCNACGVQHGWLHIITSNMPWYQSCKG